MDNDRAVIALAALAQQSRLSVFRRLVALGPAGAFAGELAGYLQIPANTLSFHLKTLAHAGLVVAQSQGRHVSYRVDFVQMQSLMGFLNDHCCAGQPELCAPASAHSQTARPAKSAPG